MRLEIDVTSRTHAKPLDAMDTREEQMNDAAIKQESQQFAVFAIRRSDPTPLIQTKMSFKQLMDGIVVPYESGGLFFLDGAPVKATDLERIKVLKTSNFFEEMFSDFHWEMRNHSDVRARELCGKQYHIKVEALLRESGEDVTSQVVNAYQTAIKPRLGDYSPNKEALLNAAVKIYSETARLLGGA